MRAIDSLHYLTKLIDRQVDVFYKGDVLIPPNITNKENYIRGVDRGIEIAKELLSCEPDVDSVAVVRCSECVYWDKATVRKGFLICPASGMEIMACDYCSYGERRETS